MLDEARKDFHIGKQKAVDLLEILRHVGWDHLHMMCEGVPEEERRMLPIRFWGNERVAPEKRIKDWLSLYGRNKTITVVDNPCYLIVEKNR